MRDLVVIVTKNGTEFLPDLLNSILEASRICPDTLYHPKRDTVIVDMGSTNEDHHKLLGKLKRQGWKVDRIGHGYATEGYLHAYRKYKDVRRYMFMHDSLVVKEPNWIKIFRNKLGEKNLGPYPCGVVPWITFDLFFDSPEQTAMFHSIYGSEDWPRKGIFGPIFYTGRKHLDKLDSMGLLPKSSQNRVEEQGWERGWAMAYHKAGLGKNPVYHGFNLAQFHNDEYPIFKKHFAGR